MAFFIAAVSSPLPVPAAPNHLTLRSAVADADKPALFNPFGGNYKAVIRGARTASQ